MLDADFFRRFGLFVDKGFLEPDLCSRLRSEVQSSRRFAATVRASGADYGVDERRRNTAWADISSEANDLVEDRLAAIKRRLEKHYSVALAGFQPLQFLVYEEGDFFRAHRDSSHDDEAPEFSKSRRISCVIFLNGAGTEEDGYGGGALTFYGLLDDGQSDPIGLPLRGEEGLLVAFGSETMHEVTPVTRGERYTVVTWFV